MYVASTTPRNGCPEAADTLEVPDGAKENNGGAAAEAAEAMGCVKVPVKPKVPSLTPGIGAVGSGARGMPQPRLHALICSLRATLD